MNRKLGSELKAGDTIRVIGGSDTITKLEPYIGTLFTPDQASVATFARAKVGMTIEHERYYEVAL